MTPKLHHSLRALIFSYSCSIAKKTMPCLYSTMNWHLASCYALQPPPRWSPCSLKHIFLDFIPFIPTMALMALLQSPVSVRFACLSAPRSVDSCPAVTHSVSLTLCCGTFFSTPIPAPEIGWRCQRWTCHGPRCSQNTPLPSQWLDACVGNCHSAEIDGWSPLALFFPAPPRHDLWPYGL